ncbi:hypothetical protein HDU89_006645 [Geranomyces variabilis]|nr:hypothetical protein HDU89_006645 [Geranomyces variabilis]
MTITKEQAFLEHILENVKPFDPLNDSFATASANVVAAGDAFGNETWLMAVGDVKGALIDELIAKKQPKVMIELGCYCGYSAVRFGALVARNPDAHYYSFEVNENFADIARQVIQRAGLESRVTIIIGSFSEAFSQLRTQYNVSTVDMVFIDHHKLMYLPDFQIMQQNSLLASGSVVVADNVIKPGAPDYLEYVLADPSLDSELIMTEYEYSNGLVDDGIAVSHVL